MTTLTQEPHPCGYIVLWSEEVTCWDADENRLYAADGGGVSIFADQFAAETAMDRTQEQVDSTRREFQVSPIYRVRAKETP